MKNGCREIVKEYCKNISPLVFTKNQDGLTAIHYAILKGHYDLANLLIEKVVSLNKSVEDSEATKFMIMSILGEDFKHFDHFFQPTTLDAISTIPHIYRRIFDYLELDDLLSLSETNKQWNSNLKDPYFWLKRCFGHDLVLDWAKLEKALREKYEHNDFKRYKDEMTNALKIFQHQTAAHVAKVSEILESDPPEMFQIVAKYGYNLAGKWLISSQRLLLFYLELVVAKNYKTTLLVKLITKSYHPFWPLLYICLSCS